MAKVIGIDTRHQKQCTCSKCASIIEYTGVDVRENRYTDYGGFASVQGLVVCPACGHNIVVYDR